MPIWSLLPDKITVAIEAEIMELKCEEIAVRIRPMLSAEKGKREMVVHAEVRPT